MHIKMYYNLQVGALGRDDFLAFQNELDADFELGDNSELLPLQASSSGLPMIADIDRSKDTESNESRSKGPQRKDLVEDII